MTRLRFTSALAWRIAGVVVWAVGTGVAVWFVLTYGGGR